MFSNQMDNVGRGTMFHENDTLHSRQRYRRGELTAGEQQRLLSGHATVVLHDDWAAVRDRSARKQTRTEVKVFLRIVCKSVCVE